MCCKGPAEEAFVEQYGVRHTKVGNALQARYSLSGVGLVKAVDQAGRDLASTVKDGTHACFDHCADAFSGNAGALSSGAKRVHAEVAVN